MIPDLEKYTLQAFVYLLYIVKDFFPASTVLGTGNEVRRKFFPLLGQFFHVGTHIGSELAVRQLVGLGEDKTEGDAVLAQPFDELQVYLLRLVTRIDQKEETRQLLAIQNVGSDHVLQLLLFLFAPLGITIAREIHKVPFFVDDKMIDEHRLARRRTGLGQLGMVGKHIDKAALAHVATTNEGVLRQATGGTLLHQGTADEVFCGFYLHIK